MKKRAGGYFGLHFDFHAGQNDTDIGVTTTKERIFLLLDKVKPDYIQCDCKGHAGWSSYPTKAGNAAPGIKKDILKIWREATASRGIPLVMHYSGVWDTRAVELHPEWAAVGEDGAASTKITSTFGEYVDKLMIPQLIELAVDYKVDAVWVDGECWATIPDFNPKVLELFKNETGYSEVEKEVDSPSRKAFRDFCRKQFFKYLNHYVDEVHKAAPDFEIASNWAFSSHIPEEICSNVDYLSGDFAPTDSYNSSRFEARALARRGLPWDLMAWGFFSSNAGRATKSVVALSREAAPVISMGGGFQVYNKQDRKGAPEVWLADNMAKVAEFCRDRKKWAAGASPLPVTAVLYSKTDMYSRHDRLFISGGHSMVQGALRAILDGGHPVDLIYEYQIENNERTTIIIPECKYLSDEVISMLKKHVENGGSIIVSGTSCAFFEDILGIKTGEIKKAPFHCDIDGQLVSQNAEAVQIELNGAKVLTEAYETNERDSRKFPAMTVNKYKKGTAIAFTWNIFECYFNGITYSIRDLVCSALKIAEPEPAAELLSGLKNVDIIPSKKDGRLLLNLINTSGIYSEARVCTYDEVPPIYNLTFRVKTQIPISVILQPENIPLKFEYDGKYTTFTVDRLDIHSVTEITTSL